jgi:putative glutamine amidotransferase
MDAPVIGLCAALERARFGVWEQDAVLLGRSYVDAVQDAGGIALLLAPDPLVTAEPDRVLDLLDGLIVAGGRDVDPTTYGEDAHPATDAPRSERDHFEIALARRALERDLPFLGVCRGMQVMNVARGGTLVQHLPEHVGHEHHRRTAGTFDGNDHPVRLREGSLAARAAGELEHATLSHHHQGVDRLGEGLAVSGWSAEDDVPEALEDPERGFALGVQWHPEADGSSRVIAALVEEARAHARRRREAPHGGISPAD